MTVKLNLPLRASISVVAVTNAGRNQRVTLVHNLPTQNVWEGSGDGNHEIGRTTIWTPNYSSDARGWPVEVKLENRQDDGTWVDSKARIGPAYGGPNPLFAVYAEDAGDDDYNDTILFFFQLG